MMGVSQLAVSTMLGDSRQQQQTGSLGWRIGVALTTKPGKTLMFTKECHNIDKLKQQGVTESLAIVTPEGVGGGELDKPTGKTVVVCIQALQYMSLHKPWLIILLPGPHNVTPPIQLTFKARFELSLFTMLAKLPNAFQDSA